MENCDDCCSSDGGIRDSIERHSIESEDGKNGDGLNEPNVHISKNQGDNDQLDPLWLTVKHQVLLQQH